MPRKRLRAVDYKASAVTFAAVAVETQIPDLPKIIWCGRKKASFLSWYGLGLDNIVEPLHALIYERSRLPERFSPKTVFNSWYAIDRTFIPFLTEWCITHGRAILLVDIDKALIISYLSSLKKCPAHTTSGFLTDTSQEHYYNRTKSLLYMLCIRRLLSRDIFPAHAFRNRIQRTKPHKAYSSEERNRILQALCTDLAQWRAGHIKLANVAALNIIFLLIAARTGRNMTPLLELKTDSLRDHPLKPDRKLLLTYKRRGYTAHLQSFARDSEKLEATISVRNDVTSLFQMACEISAPARAFAPEELRDRLWIWVSDVGINRGAISVMHERTYIDNTRAWATRHELLADDGKPLKVNISRLRKTFEGRIWNITDGDLFATAVLGGHTPRVADTHYLEPPPGAERNFKWCGEAWVDYLRGEQDFDESVCPVVTPVGRCRDSLGGKYAPKNGISHCTNFLACFRCPSQLVTLDDLWRLLSFYWLLIKERREIPRKRWSKLYGHVIRVIDQSILPIFEKDNKSIVDGMRERARKTPHPMWRDRNILAGNALVEES